MIADGASIEGMHWPRAGTAILCRTSEREIRQKTIYEGEDMKPSTEDQIKGSIHKGIGAVKEKVGQLTHQPDLEVEGQDEQIAGKVQEKVGQIEKVLDK